jgi:hypothetical protein
MRGDLEIRQMAVSQSIDSCFLAPKFGTEWLHNDYQRPTNFLW